MYWIAKAPANIALIKYMGKKNAQDNVPDNASLSYTLNNLLSTVVLEKNDLDKDVWQPLENQTHSKLLHLSITSQQRFINHLQRLKNYFNYQGHFTIKSANNFPQGSGLASSASSFAALTQCAVHALSELTDKPVLSVLEQACLSRMGSGSSCRSFYTPWCLWHEQSIEPIEIPYQKLIHQVIIISAAEKKVSSSQAHQRVKQSTLYAGRAERAEQRLQQLLRAFHRQEWATAYDLCWQEFHDMHQLFHHCAQPFTYMNEQSIDMLRVIQQYWDKHSDGPIVTMDAGPNIHLLYRLDQAEMAQQFTADYLVGHYDVL